MSSASLPAATAQRLYDQATALVALGAWECDLARETLTWTDGVYDLFGLPRGSVLHRPSTLDFYHDHSRREMEQRRAAAIATGQGFALDCRIRTSAGEDRWMRLRVGVGYEHNRPARIFGAKQDVTAEKRMWDGLVTLAQNDPLTGLANRRAFEEMFRDLGRDRADQIDRFALVVLDVDHFKSINDRVGHAAGDDCLRCVAGRLERLFPDALLVSRIGGDEFAVLLHVPAGQRQLATILDHAQRLLARPVPRDSGAIEIGISMGAAMLKPSHRADPRKLFAEADSALYVAKAAGRNRVRIFDGLVTGREAPQALAG